MTLDFSNTKIAELVKFRNYCAGCCSYYQK